MEPNNSIYFLDKDHESNFKELLMKWPHARTGDTEYQTACYILSVPNIFGKVKHLYFEEGEENPIEWIARWEEAYTLPELEEDFEDDEESIEPDYDLTHSMVQLGRLAYNLFNGYEHFNLMHCIASLDEEHYKVLKCALDMRLGYYK
ncbi:hypothetical protein GLW08_21295 [Pontibacillus yanchengensis]|uniref:Uncharacterized protein n=2 Tax=Pontibacillus yanchengensis TaxID=462910 RepID=A0ACC7VMP3_9BACI|nr:hypothetical protein [Pontibacillus yanchengensis]MYL35420.1 hypothetical protein [Pontibacillus yanchengensis]MYL55839.1 hypothetical protein [Pontibacillus yanchengensis]